MVVVSFIIPRIYFWKFLFPALLKYNWCILCICVWSELKLTYETKMLIPMLRKHDIKYVVDFLSYKIIFLFSQDAFNETVLYMV